MSKQQFVKCENLFQEINEKQEVIRANLYAGKLDMNQAVELMKMPVLRHEFSDAVEALEKAIAK